VYAVLTTPSLPPSLPPYLLPSPGSKTIPIPILVATALLFIGPAIQAISDGQNFFLVREGGREGGREGEVQGG